MFLGLAAFTFSRCDKGSGTIGTSENNPENTVSPLNINVKYQESYDQKEMTFSNYWPQGTAVSVSGKSEGASTQSAQGELLVDYEYTRETVSFDDEGYMSTTREFLEGDGEMNMPEELYNRIKDEMPAKSADHDPIVRTEMANGVERAITRSGEIAYEQEYPVEDFRIDPEMLDSLRSMHNDTSNVDAAVQRNIKQLNNSGLSFNVRDRFYASYSQPAGPAENSDIAEYNYVMDLRTGQVIASILKDAQGRKLSSTMRQYQYVNGVYIMANEETHLYGKINGEWDVTTRKIINRDNIEVIFN